MIRFACPTCGAKVSVKEERAGASLRCPRCKETLRVPGGGATPDWVKDAAADELPFALPVHPPAEPAVPMKVRWPVEFRILTWVVLAIVCLGLMSWPGSGSTDSSMSRSSWNLPRRPNGTIRRIS